MTARLPALGVGPPGVDGAGTGVDVRHVPLAREQQGRNVQAGHPSRRRCLGSVGQVGVEPEEPLLRMELRELPEPLPDPGLRAPRWSSSAPSSSIGE